MSYPRPRSRGCHACRERKIKCDQEKPHCQRCVRSGRICPGYRPEDELVFRDMSKTAEQRVERRVEGSKAKRDTSIETYTGTIHASAPGSEPEDCSLVVSSIDDQTLERLEVSVPLPMSPDWSFQASCLFVADYVFVSEAQGTPDGFLEFLPKLCGEEPQSACLMEALDAVSFANLTNQSSLSWSNLRACKSYGKALKSLNAALQDTQEAAKDSTLTSVFLLAMYELISGDRPSVTFWDAHVLGGQQLICLRGSQRLRSEREKSLFRIMFTQIQLAHLIKRSLIPVKIINLLLKLNQGLLHTKYALFLTKLANIRCTAPKAYKQLNLYHEPTRRRMRAWFEEAVALDSKIQIWAKTAVEKFPALKYKELINDPASQPKIVHVYQDIWVASMWDSYRSARILLHLDLLDCEARFRAAAVSPPLPIPDPQQQVETWNATISTMVNEICASVPFLLGDFDAKGNLQNGAGRMALGGMFLLWPLQVIIIAGVIHRDQMVWIKDRLNQMRYRMGIHQAKHLRSRL